MSKKTLTHWSRPTEIIDSGYGKITYREWCEKECDRVNVRGDGVRIVERKDGFIALSRKQPRKKCSGKDMSDSPFMTTVAEITLRVAVEVSNDLWGGVEVSGRENDIRDEIYEELERVCKSHLLAIPLEVEIPHVIVIETE